MSADARSAAGTSRRPPLAAITFDFGNTLVPVDRAALDAVVDALADGAASRLRVGRDEFLAAWRDERARQLREELPRFREVDLSVRLRRVLARLRGMPSPGPDAAWDDSATAARSDAAEVAWALDAYSRAFVDALPPDAALAAMLGRLAGRARLGILSNWPLAVTIDRYADAAGWTPHLAAIVVSERVGTIKPHPAIFRAAEAALAGPGAHPLPPGSILHVGDDWGADVVGATRAGWRAAHLRTRPADSPLPVSDLDDDVEPDVVLDRLSDLEAALDRLGDAPRSTGDRRAGVDPHHE